MDSNDAYLEIQRRMTDDERARFMAWILKRNPHLRGAHVADVLQELDDHDAMLEVREPFLQQYNVSAFNRVQFRVASVAAAVLMHEAAERWTGIEVAS